MYLWSWCFFHTSPRPPMGKKQTTVSISRTIACQIVAFRMRNQRIHWIHIIVLCCNANKIKSTQNRYTCYILYGDIVCMRKQWAIKRKLFALSVRGGGIACSVKCYCIDLSQWFAYSVQERQKHDVINPVQSFVCACVSVLYVCMTYVFGFILFCSSIRPSRVQQQLTQFAAHRVFSHKTHLRSKKNAFRATISNP